MRNIHFNQLAPRPSTVVRPLPRPTRDLVAVSPPLATDEPTPVQLTAAVAGSTPPTAR